MKNSYLQFGGGVTNNLTDKKMVSEAGVEFGGIRFGDGLLSINAGYLFNIEEANMHFGLGFNFENVDFGYAYIPGTYLPAPYLCKQQQDYLYK